MVGTVMRLVWDLLAAIGIFATILATVGYAWGYFG